MGLFSIGAALIGGILRNRAQRRADRRADLAAQRQEYLNSPAGIRAESEKAGFNPLTFAPAAGAFGATPQIFSATGLADAFAQIGGIVNDEDLLRQRNTELEQSVEKLDKRLREHTLASPIGGIYDRPQQPQSTNRPAGNDGGVSAVSSDGGASNHASGGDPSGDRTPRDLITVADEGQLDAERLSPAEIYNAGRTGRQFFGLNILPHPGFSDMDEIEARTGEGGEIGEMAHWAVRNLADIGWTLGRQISTRREQDFFRELYTDRRQLSAPVGDFNAREIGQPLFGPRTHDYAPRSYR